MALVALVEHEVVDRRIVALQADVAAVVGVLNAAHGRLVALVGRALDEGLWQQWGIHSPAHWLAWQGGLAPARARAIVALAERSDQLPAVVEALQAGELALDAATEIARRAPGAYQASITEFAKVATVSQLRRCLRRYAYDDDTEQTRPRPVEDDRSVAMGTDDTGWWLKGRLPADEGAVVEAAIRAARDDRYRQERAACADGEHPTVSLADGLLAVAEASLAAGEARVPGTDRYRVHLHLDASPTTDDPTGVLSLHLGPPLPVALHALLTCDATVQPVFEVHGTPVSVGRTTRIVSRRLRRVVEHRDGGCRIPGCDRRTGLEIHHLVHWEHGGPTDTANLVSLCRAHHRAHHLGHLTLGGSPDRPDGLTCADRHGRPLPGAGRPTAPTHPDPVVAARILGVDVPPGTYQHPLGERLDPSAVHFDADHRTPPPRAAAPARTPRASETRHRRSPTASGDPPAAGPPAPGPPAPLPGPGRLR